MKIDIDRHGPRPMPNNCKNFNPPNFSLPTTFNWLIYAGLKTAVVQEGEGVEFEVKEAIPSILYLGRKFSREAINVTGPLVS
jgi:hypothetical protein